MRSPTPLVATTTLCVLVLPPPALAARYTKAETRVEVRSSKALALPKSSAPDAGAADARSTTRSKPRLSAARYRKLTRRRVTRLTVAAARKLEELLHVTPVGDPDRPDVLFRLAEHYREQMVAAEHAARALDEPIYQSSDPARKARLRREQRRHTTTSKRYLQRALTQYLAIYREPRYSRYKRIDVALWGLASLLVQSGRRGHARKVFSRLIRQHPQSRYVPDAMLSFAEHYFASGDVANALTFYRRVARYPKSPLYDYALYKTGWCWLNLKDPRRALELFVRILRRSRRAAKTRGHITLAREAAKDAVRAYARVGTPARAWAFFNRIAGATRAPTMMQRLAQLYFDDGKFAASAGVLKKLIALRPRSPKLCSWQHAIVRSSLPSKNKPAQLVEAKRLVAVLSHLRKRASAKAAHVRRCAATTADVLRGLATTWHREAQTTKNKATYALADHLYAEYLDAFPRARDSHELAFYRAELLFQLERFRRAARAYKVVITLAPRGKHAVESAWAAVIALKNALAQRDEINDTQRNSAASPAGGANARRPKRRSIGKGHRALIGACTTFIRVAPRSPRVVAVKYRRARIYYVHEHYKKAAALFAELLRAHPRHALAVYSANLMLDAYNSLGDTPAVARWVKRLLAHRELGRNPTLRPTLLELSHQLERKRAAKLRVAKRYRECGEAYARLANQRPDDPRWDELVYMAALCFEEAKLIGLAISMRSSLIRAKPTSPLAHKALYQIGANYHALAWFSRAADYYEQFAKRFPGEQKAPKALQNAIVFRLGRGEDARALADARLFARTYGRRREHAQRSAAVTFAVGTTTLRGKPARAVVAYYRRYLARWRRVGGADRAARAHLRIARALWRASCPVRGVDGACVRVSLPAVRYYSRGASRVRLSCGPRKKRVTIVKRDRRLARRARRHLAAALRLARSIDGGGGGARLDARRRAALARAVGEALFIEAEAELERYLALRMPRGLDFVRAQARAMRRLRTFLLARARKLDVARRLYVRAVEHRDAHWAIAAAARVGQLFKWYADALYAAPVPLPRIPAVLRSASQRRDYVDTFVTRYCDQLEVFARVPERKSERAFGLCLRKSNQLSWFSSWSRLCERELNSLAPTKYPLASELRASAGFVRISPDRATLRRRLR